MAAVEMISGGSASAADHYELLSTADAPEAAMDTCLTADSDLYKRILQHQPIVLLRRIKIDKIPKHGSHFSHVEGDDGQMESSGSEYNMDHDSDEDWTEHQLSKKRCRIHCLFCFTSYRRQSDLDNHIRTTHGNECMPFICRICGRGFMQEKSLLYHARRKCCNGQMNKIQPVNDAERMMAMHHARNAATNQNNAANQVSRCKNRQTYHNSALVDTLVPSSCHNGSSDHLRVKGVKLQFSESRQFCAKLMYAEARDESIKEPNSSHEHNVPSLNELPSFHNEGELVSYLREKSKAEGRRSMSHPVLCPVCKKAVVQDILGHLRHHKQVLLNCKRQNRYLCDVCFTDSDSIEWMIRHQEQSHGKSFQLTSGHSDEQTSADNTTTSGAISDKDMGQLPELDAVSQFAEKEVQELSVPASSANFSDTKNLSTNDCHDIIVFSQHSGVVTNMQNVIEIKPVSDECNIESIYDACSSNKTAVSSSSPSFPVKHPLQTIPEYLSGLNSASESSEANQSPGPPILYPPMNNFPLVEESCSEMPNLCKESDNINNINDDDLIMFSDTKPPPKKQSVVTVKQEKDTDGCRCEIQQPTTKVSKAGKCLSERSFMDALIPTLDPVCPTSTSNPESFSNNIASSRDSCISSLQSSFMDSGISSHVLSTSGADYTMETMDVDTWQTKDVTNIRNGSTSDVSNLSMPPQQLTYAGNTQDVENAIDMMQQLWAATEKPTADSTESDSGVSEVKLEDDELQDEVIVIDLDDRSVVRECIAGETGAERSLQPAEHKAMLRVKEEDKNLEAESYLQMLENDQRVISNKQMSSIGSPSSSSDSSSSSSMPLLTVVTNNSQERSGDTMKEEERSGDTVKEEERSGDTVKEEERTWMLEKQKELFEKLERFLEVISDQPVSAAGQSDQNGDLRSQNCKVSRMNGSLYNNVREKHRAQQHSRSLLNCDICGKGFPSIGLLNKHKRFAHVNQKLMMNSIGSKQDTVRSPTQPTGELKLRAYPCSKCGEYYPSLALLHEHKKIVHKLTSKYLCLQCDKSFNSRGQLQSHMRWKHKRTKDKSAATPASVITKAMLKQGCFSNSPTDGKSCGLPCNDIIKWGTNSKPVQNLTHNSGSKIAEPCLTGSSGMQAPDYMCTSCGKTFISLDDRLRHERLFCKVKKLSCGQCGKTFLHSSSLAKHTKKHENIRYICDVCGLAYLSVYSIKLHRQRQHPEAPSFNVKWLKVELDQMPNRLSR